MSIGTDVAAAAAPIADPLASGTALPTDTLTQDAIPADNMGASPTAETGSAPPDPWNSLTSYLAEQAQERADRNAAAGNPHTTTYTGPGAGAGGSATGVGLKIIQAAEHLLGTDYKWGGNGVGGVDCSGLVKYAYAAAGIQLPRISYEQANSGARVAINALRPGDLVAWDNSPRNPGADHIAIYVGNGMIIEAAHPGSTVRIRKLGGTEGAWGVRMGW